MVDFVDSFVAVVYLDLVDGPLNGIFVLLEQLGLPAEAATERVHGFDGVPRGRWVWHAQRTAWPASAPSQLASAYSTRISMTIITVVGASTPKKRL